LGDGDPPVVVVVFVVVVVVGDPGEMLPPPDGADVVVVVDVVEWLVDVVVGVVAVFVVWVVVGTLAVVGVVDVAVVDWVGATAEDVLWLLLPPHPARASAPSSTPKTSFLMAYLLSGAPAGESSVGRRARLQGDDPDAAARARKTCAASPAARREAQSAR
jgi:hypothetical protein